MAKMRLDGLGCRSLFPMRSTKTLEENSASVGDVFSEFGGDGGERHREGIILSEEMLQTPPESQEEANLRACIVELAALSEAAYDKEMDILNQFDAKGCAEVYVEEGDE